MSTCVAVGLGMGVVDAELGVAAAALDAVGVALDEDLGVVPDPGAGLGPDEDRGLGRRDLGPHGLETRDRYDLRRKELPQLDRNQTRSLADRELLVLLSLLQLAYCRPKRLYIAHARVAR